MTHTSRLWLIQSMRRFRAPDPRQDNTPPGRPDFIHSAYDKQTVEKAFSAKPLCNSLAEFRHPQMTE